MSIKPVSAEEKSNDCFSFKKTFITTCKYAPKIIIPLVAGYYVLGYAYGYGLMAAIDRLAIQFLLDQNMGYLAIGALMPTIQWYSAWGVRCSAGLMAFALYEIALKITLYAIDLIQRLVRETFNAMNLYFSPTPPTPLPV